MKRALALLAAIFFAAGICAEEIRVSVSADATARDCLPRARVHIDEDAADAKRIGSSTFLVHVSAGARIRAEASGCWSETVVWNGAKELDLRMFRAATVEGVFEHPKATVPAGVTGSVYVSGGIHSINETAPELLRNDTACELEEARWRCIVPGGAQFDLRLDVSGFASLYYWDLVAPPGETKTVEPQTLKAGASVTGWVQTRGEVPIRGARVTIFPLLQQRGAARRETRMASMRTARTNHRGFFQLDGLEAGRFRLVSEAPGLSPVVIPELELRSPGTMTLQRAVRHEPFAEAEVIVEPATDSKEQPWSVEIVEAVPLYPGRRRSSIARPVTKDGVMSARSLRADVYDVVIRDSAGAVVQRAELDLFGGGRRTLHLSVRPVTIRGVVKAGGEAVRAELRFSDGREFVTAATDDGGRFETPLPKKGVWAATVLYPPGELSARIDVPAIEVPQELEPGAMYDVTIELPGGRLRGEVVDGRGRSAAAVVYLRRKDEERLAAQQMTGDDGRFDIVGLKPGNYAVEAQTAEGGTPRAVEVVVDEHDSAAVKIVTESYALFSGHVLTPEGRPASGAVVRYSPDGGNSWTEVTADIRGYFEKHVNGAVVNVPVIVLTYDYPAAVFTAPNGERLRVQLRHDGGVIHFGGDVRTLVSARGVTVAAFLFHHPKPHGRFNGGIWVESGTYALCRRPDECRSVTVTPGSEQTIALEHQTRSGGTS